MMWNPFSKLGGFFKAIGRAFVKIFSSKEAQDVFKIILEQVLPEAKPVVEQIRAIIKSPTQATATDIFNLYANFNRTLDNIIDNPQEKANAVLNLATDLVDAATGNRFATPLLHSAIELALSAIKAEGK